MAVRKSSPSTGVASLAETRLLPLPPLPETDEPPARVLRLRLSARIGASRPPPGAIEAAVAAGVDRATITGGPVEGAALELRFRSGDGKPGAVRRVVVRPPAGGLNPSAPPTPGDIADRVMARIGDRVRVGPHDPGGRLLVASARAVAGAKAGFAVALAALIVDPSPSPHPATPLLLFAFRNGSPASRAALAPGGAAEWMPRAVRAAPGWARCGLSLVVGGAAEEGRAATVAGRGGWGVALPWAVVGDDGAPSAARVARPVALVVDVRAAAPGGRAGAPPHTGVSASAAVRDAVSAALEAARRALPGGGGLLSTADREALSLLPFLRDTLISALAHAAPETRARAAAVLARAGMACEGGGEGGGDRGASSACVALDRLLRRAHGLPAGALDEGVG